MQASVIVNKYNWVTDDPQEATGGSKDQSQILEEEQAKEETLNNIRSLKNFAGTGALEPIAPATLSQDNNFVDLVTGEAITLGAAATGDEVSIATIIDLLARGVDDDQIIEILDANFSSMMSNIVRDKSRAKKYLAHLMELMAIMELSFKSQNKNPELQKSLRMIQEKLSTLIKENNVSKIQEFLKSKTLTEVISQSIKMARPNIDSLMAATLALRQVAQDAAQQKQLNPKQLKQALYNAQRDALLNSLHLLKDAYNKLKIEFQKESDPGKRKSLQAALKDLVEMAARLKQLGADLKTQDPARVLETMTKALRETAFKIELMVKTLPVSLAGVDSLRRLSEHLTRQATDLPQRTNTLPASRLNPADLANKLSLSLMQINTQKLDLRAMELSQQRRPEQSLKFSPAQDMLRQGTRVELKSDLAQNSQLQSNITALNAHQNITPASNQTISLHSQLPQPQQASQNLQTAAQTNYNIESRAALREQQIKTSTIYPPLTNLPPRMAPESPQPNQNTRSAEVPQTAAKATEALQTFVRLGEQPAMALSVPAQSLSQSQISPQASRQEFRQQVQPQNDVGRQEQIHQQVGQAQQSVQQQSVTPAAAVPSPTNNPDQAVSQDAVQPAQGQVQQQGTTVSVAAPSAVQVGGCAGCGGGSCCGAGAVQTAPPAAGVSADAASAAMQAAASQEL